ncbi:hypothetical protein O181_123770 [Austropuccinia psidii MF-1]|uniref:Uncharacterized protein n=1 Tax=Austropuccinia psidii MF-1 TaxID=1389203 RepID=A0A9Q3KLR8_9BASI|nr:hypothetical protein [Austropuccinia psidii MF-1]
MKEELDIRTLDMKLSGIGGNSTALFGLAENTHIISPSKIERRIHFFVARGAVHTAIGRPFLEYNGIRLEHSHNQGEILSYKEPDGRRFCIPICSPETKGWNIHPPAEMKLCNASQIEECMINNISHIRQAQELPQENSRTTKNKVPIKPNPENPIKHSKTASSSNYLRISTK